jgi:hypothetical protein
MDLTDLIRFHREKGAEATIALTRVEKPLEMEEGRVCDWSKDIFPQLLAQGRPMYGYISRDYWCDIGSLEQCQQASEDALAGRVRVAISGEELRRSVRPGLRLPAGDSERHPVQRGGGGREWCGMSAVTCVAEAGGMRLGVMVRTDRELFVYWSLPEDGATPALRVLDVTGRAAPELVDGTGVRECAVRPGAGSAYIGQLLPGHLYMVELGESGLEAFRPLLAAGPVQTPGPGAASGADPAFPSPYQRS